MCHTFRRLQISANDGRNENLVTQRQIVYRDARIQKQYIEQYRFMYKIAS